MGLVSACVSAFVSMFFSAYCAVKQPNKMFCPAGFWIDGIRPDGRFNCRIDFSNLDIVVAGRLYCTNGTPILTDNGRRVFVYCAPQKL